MRNVFRHFNLSRRNSSCWSLLTVESRGTLAKLTAGFALELRPDPREGPPRLTELGPKRLLFEVRPVFCSAAKTAIWERPTRLGSETARCCSTCIFTPSTLEFPTMWPATGRAWSCMWGEIVIGRGASRFQGVGALSGMNGISRYYFWFLRALIWSIFWKRVADRCWITGAQNDPGLRLKLLIIQN